MTYAEIVALLQDYLETSSAEFVAAIPSLVALAENRIYLATNLPVFNTEVSSALVAGVRTMALPTDFVSVNALALRGGTRYTTLLERDAAFIDEVFPHTSGDGAPRYYALVDHDTIALGPTPDSNYTVKLSYVYRPPSIVTASTSWLGTHAASVLFYGALTEAYVYMKGDATLLAVYAGRYAEAIDRLQVLGAGASKRDQFKIDAPRRVPA